MLIHINARRKVMLNISGRKFSHFTAHCTWALTHSGSSIIHRSTRLISSLKLCIHTLDQRFWKVFFMLKKLVSHQITCNFSMTRDNALLYAMIHHYQYFMCQMPRSICICQQITWQPIPLYPICWLMQWSTMMLFHMSLI